ncbi:HEAT repeat domain-containing protein [Microbacterium sp. NPDC055903]
MTRAEQWRQELAATPETEWPALLDANSGLPGPRANLELATAFADLAPSAVTIAASEDEDEFRAFCGALALGARARDASVLGRLHVLASDPRWRVREAVATGLQRLGDAEPDALRQIVLAWADDEDLLVQRAAVAAICEPRLLRAPGDAAIALEVCARTTAHLAALPGEVRRTPEAKTLRKALGYCWSVAIAADPEHGREAFERLDRADRDVDWIVTSNLRKKRIAGLF